MRTCYFTKNIKILIAVFTFSLKPYLFSIYKNYTVLLLQFSYALSYTISYQLFLPKNSLFSQKHQNSHCSDSTHRFGCETLTFLHLHSISISIHLCVSQLFRLLQKLTFLTKSLKFSSLHPRFFPKKHFFSPHLQKLHCIISIF